jgi:hypothetical protein
MVMRYTTIRRARNQPIYDKSPVPKYAINFRSSISAEGRC